MHNFMQSLSFPDLYVVLLVKQCNLFMLANREEYHRSAVDLRSLFLSVGCHDVDGFVCDVDDAAFEGGEGDELLFVAV